MDIKKVIELINGRYDNWETMRMTDTNGQSAFSHLMNPKKYRISKKEQNA